MITAAADSPPLLIFAKGQALKLAVLRISTKLAATVATRSGPGLNGVDDVLSGANTMRLTIIPYTRAPTNLQLRTPDDLINVESDVLSG